MKNKVQFIISLFISFTSLGILFPSATVDAAKLESGVTINATSTTETEKICDDEKDNDNDGKIDADDKDCVAQGGQSAEPCGPQTLNQVECMKQGIDTETKEKETCGPQTLSGIPINYGELNVGQESSEHKVTIKNEGTIPMIIIFKGGSWINDSPGNPAISGPEITHIGVVPNVNWGDKMELQVNGFYLFGVDFKLGGGQSIPVYFQLKVPTGSVSGSFHQEVTIDGVCSPSSNLPLP